MTRYMKIAGTVISKKHLPVVPRLVTSLAMYGASAAILVCWFSDLPQVMKYVPFYRNNLRFPYEDDKRVFILPRKDL